MKMRIICFLLGEGSPFFGLLDPQRKLESNIELKVQF